MAMTEKQRLYQQQWRKDNPEQYKEQQRRTRVSRDSKINSDPEYFVDYTLATLTSGAHARGYAFNLSRKQLKTLLTETQICSLSGRTLVLKKHSTDKASVDRIDNRFGYSVKNCQVVSTQVNKHRLDLPVEDFVKMCCDVAEHHGWKAPVDKKAK
jgi:hypothetical protein